MVPCPWIVELWTHQPQHPVADSQDWLRHQVVVAEVTRPHGRRLNRGQRRARPRTPPTGRSRRRSSQARPRARTRSTKMHKVIAGNPVQRLKEPSRRSARSCGISITGTGGTAPGREAGHFAQVGRAWRRCTAPRMGVVRVCRMRPQSGLTRRTGSGPAALLERVRVAVWCLVGLGAEPLDPSVRYKTRPARGPFLDD